MTKLLTELRDAHRAEARRLAEIDRATELFRALCVRVELERKARLGCEPGSRVGGGGMMKKGG